MYNLTYRELRRAGNKSKQNRKQQDEEDISTPFWPDSRPRPEEIAAPNSDPAEASDFNELEDLIWEKYNPSNPKWREASRLRYKYGWKLADIAEKMNIKLGTLKALLSREKERLAKFLNAHGYNLPFRS
jgi:RNA polymerase sigma factor (sigma-70 family)